MKEDFEGEQFQIEAISFLNVNISGEQLEEFIRKYQKTLKKIWLRQCFHITTQDLIKIFEGNGRLNGFCPVLEKIHFHDLLIKDSFLPVL